MREIRQSGSEGGARFNPSFLPLSESLKRIAVRFAHPSQLPTQWQGCTEVGELD